MHLNKLNKKGFTLVETLGVIVILGVIALIAVPALTASLGDADQSYYANLTRLVELAGRDYYLDHRTLAPISEGDKGKVDLSNLVRLKYIDQPQSTSKNDCIGYVEVTKSTQLDYLTCLKCDDYESNSACDFSGGSGDGSGIGSRKDGYLTIDQTYYEVEQDAPFVAPFASYYYDGELVRSDIGATPTYIDTSILTTYTLTYYYLNATPITIQVKIMDVTPPSMIDVTLRKDSLTGTSYTGGWTKSDVYQIYNATDGDRGSGVKGYEYAFSNQPNNNTLWTFTSNNSITQKDLLTKLNTTSKDFNQTVYVRAVDNFDNKSEAMSYALSVDQTAPNADFVISGTKGNDTWYKSNVSISVNNQSDGAGSGVASAVVDHPSLTSDTAGQVVTLTITDKVGNVQNKTTTIKIDKSNPTVVYSTQGSPYGGGFINSATITATCQDAYSGIVNGGQSQTKTFSGRGTYQISGSCTDNVGHTINYSNSYRIFVYGTSSSACGTSPYNCNPHKCNGHSCNCRGERCVQEEYVAGNFRSAGCAPLSQIGCPCCTGINWGFTCGVYDGQCGGYEPGHSVCRRTEPASCDTCYDTCYDTCHKAKSCYY